MGDSCGIMRHQLRPWTRGLARQVRLRPPRLARYKWASASASNAVGWGAFGYGGPDPAVRVAAQGMDPASGVPRPVAHDGAKHAVVDHHEPARSPDPETPLFVGAHGLHVQRRQAVRQRVHALHGAVADGGETEVGPRPDPALPIGAGAKDALTG